MVEEQLSRPGTALLVDGSHNPVCAQEGVSIDVGLCEVGELALHEGVG